jgi:hypothetical protein
MFTKQSRTTVSFTALTNAAPAATATPSSNPTDGARYVSPALVALGNLDVVQAGRGYYYDGPNTTWLRY